MSLRYKTPQSLALTKLGAANFRVESFDVTQQYIADIFNSEKIINATFMLK